MPEKKHYLSKHFLQTLLPSMLSTVGCLLLGVAFSAYIVLSTNLDKSPIRAQYIFYQNHHHLSVGHLHFLLSQNRFFSTLPLFIFWAFVGVLVYVIAFHLVMWIRKAVDTADEIHYVNANKEALIESAAVVIVFRIVFAIALIVYWHYFFNDLLPLSVNESIMASNQTSNYISAGYMLASTVYTALALYVFVVLARLLLLKTRVFGDK